MTHRVVALFSAFLCAVIVSAGQSARAAELTVSPGDFGAGSAMPSPLPPPPVAQGYDNVPVIVNQPAGTPYRTAVAPLAANPGVGEPTGAFLPPPTAAVPVQGVAFGTDPLQAAAPGLYASLTATVTATTGDPSIPVVVRPATTAQATDAAGVPVNLAGIAAQGSPVVDWNAARAGTPYPVETPGQPGVTTYVVPIQVPVHVQAGAQPSTLAVQPVMPAQPVRPAPAALQADPSVAVIAVTPGAQPVFPTATAGTGIAGQGGVYYYGSNPVSIASTLGMDTATGAEYLDFGAMPAGAVNLVAPAQIKQALLRRTPLVVLDVRGDLVREIEGHIVGDVGVPFEPAETFPARVARAIPARDLPVVVYCNDGVWASRAADVLLGMGYRTFLMGAYRLWF